jgi:hypothetical protein
MRQRKDIHNGAAEIYTRAIREDVSSRARREDVARQTGKM